ncbi:helix-turn-helix domain-containing protein [Metapseudomonas otitidis]|uniref:helix-turn-helix domain-containing protein n=1 Tax=Metapseudomonas otitidis TaxID=319939 RepID=UPI0013F6874A|nr:helix-turn-helix domain-containing protein [Pseudomonas otitidis]
MSELKTAIEAAGGPSAAARACGKSVRAIYKWLSAKALPRTDFSGETDYAGALAKAAEARGEPFKREWLLEHAKPTSKSS